MSNMQRKMQRFTNRRPYGHPRDIDAPGYKAYRSKVEILNEKLSAESSDKDSKRLLQLHPTKGYRSHSVKRLYVTMESRKSWWSSMVGVIQRAQQSLLSKESA